MQDSDSTVAEITVSQRSRLARSTKHGFVVLLLVLCIAGVLGGLGGRTATATAAADDYRLTLQYPLTARPGLDTLWELRTSHAGGFRGPITIRVTADYFHLFETQGFYPTPSATTRDDTYVYLRFTPPRRSDVFVVTFDAYLQPYVAPSDLLRNDATVALMHKGKPVAAISYTTWVLP